MKGSLVIISSPSGGGKGTLIRMLREAAPDIAYSVSLTTRAARPGERDGVDYHFVTRAEFEAEIARGSFLEYAEVHQNLYGTSLSQIEGLTANGADCILEIDVQGAEAVMRRVPEAISIFILPPSFEILRSRLMARATEQRADLELRLANAVGEVAKNRMFEYVVINDVAAEAAARLAAIVTAERQRRIRQSTAIDAIIESFDKQKRIITGD